MQNGRAVITHPAENAAMAAGRDIAARPRVDLHDLARSKNLLLLEECSGGRAPSQVQAESILRISRATKPKFSLASNFEIKSFELSTCTNGRNSGSSCDADSA